MNTEELSEVIYRLTIIATSSVKDTFKKQRKQGNFLIAQV